MPRGLLAIRRSHHFFPSGLSQFDDSQKHEIWICIRQRENNDFYLEVRFTQYNDAGDPMYREIRAGDFDQIRSHTDMSVKKTQAYLQENSNKLVSKLSIELPGVKKIVIGALSPHDTKILVALKMNEALKVQGEPERYTNNLEVIQQHRCVIS